MVCVRTADDYGDEEAIDCRYTLRPGLHIIDPAAPTVDLKSTKYIPDFPSVKFQEIAELHLTINVQDCTTDTSLLSAACQ